MHSLAECLEGSPYEGYLYAYPHKSAYRIFDNPIPLKEVWAKEDKSSLFMYIHIPYCEMRCGFCNLFTKAEKPGREYGTYLNSLRRQGEVVMNQLGAVRFSRLALGGGTPTFLDVDELARLLDVAQSMGADTRSIPSSVESSPQTATKTRLDLLKERGVSRLSIGVQSFDEKECASVGRPQKEDDVHQALRVISEAGFETLNIDLMYGLPTQTRATWLQTLRKTVEYRPQEIYLYPLYVRPLTGLGNSRREWDDQRLDHYRRGRTFLLSNGYTQISMRMFERSEKMDTGPEYCCQEDGMVGLGCGARSYTREIHYSDEYAVGQSDVAAILASYLRRESENFRFVKHGFRLNEREQRRRYVIKSILKAEGLSLGQYFSRFNTEVRDDLPEVSALLEYGLAETAEHNLRLTAEGLERSDAIGPWLVSDAVRVQMATKEEP